MYRRRGRREYDVRRMHVQFRSVWEQGLSRASQIINNLKSKGWNVDGDFYFQGQAEREAEALRRAGYTVQKQPVAKWGDEEIYILAYKEEPKAAEAEKEEEEAPPPPPQPQPPKPKAKERDPVEEFKKMFWKNQQPDASYVDDGVVIDPTYTMAVIKKDANPTSPHSGLVKLVREITQNPNLVETLDYSKFVKAEKIGKMTRKPVKHVSFNVHCFSIDKIKRAMRVLGTKKAKAYLCYGKPLVIQGRHGHVVLVAEAANKEADEPDVVSIATVQALS